MARNALTRTGMWVCDYPEYCVEHHCPTRTGGTAEQPRLCDQHTGGRVACNDCVDDFRDDLKTIFVLVETLPEQMEEGATRGRLLANEAIPGGDALVAIGPWCDPEQREHVVASHETGQLAGEAEHADEEMLGECVASWAHTLATALGDDATASLYGVQTARSRWSRQAIYARLVYLSKHTTWAASSWPGWVVMSADIRAQVRSLEAIAAEGSSVRRSQVPCPDCGEAKLVWEYGHDARDDAWECPRPRCGTRITEDDLNAMTRGLVQHTTTEAWLTVKDAAACIHRSEQTLFRWAQKGLLETREVDGTNRVLWTEVRRLDEERPRKTRGTPTLTVVPDENFGPVIWGLRPKNVPAFAVVSVPRPVEPVALPRTPLEYCEDSFLPVQWCAHCRAA